MKTDNFKMEGNAINGVAKGSIDMFDKTIEGDLGIQPLESIDILVSNIPIIGHVLTGEDKKLITYYFKVDGALIDPNVKYVPFKNLGQETGNILKRLFLTPVKLLTDLGNAVKKLPLQPIEDSDFYERHSDDR